MNDSYAYHNPYKSYDGTLACWFLADMLSARLLGKASMSIPRQGKPVHSRPPRASLQPHGNREFHELLWNIIVS